MNKALRFATAGLLLGWIGWRTDWTTVGSAFARLEVGYWLAAVGVLVVTQIVSAVRWGIFARQLGLDGSLVRLSSYYFIGMYFNLLLPTSMGGDVVRAWYLNAGSGRKLRAAGSVLLDRANGLAVLVAIACVAVFLAPATPNWAMAAALGSAAAGVLGGVAALTLSRYLPKRRREQVGMLVEVARHPRSLAATTALSCIVQAANVALVWLVGVGLGLDIPLAYYGVFVPLVSLVTLAPVSINGMGVREGATAFFLAPLGVSETMAITLAFLWFATHLAVSVLGGGVYLFGHFAKPPASDTEKDGEHGPVDRDSDQGREGQLARAA